MVVNGPGDSSLRYVAGIGMRGMPASGMTLAGHITQPFT
jgi:hypothetical protein